VFKIGDLNMEQTVNFSVSEKNSVTLSGSVGTMDKYGTGTVSAGLRHAYSPDTYFDVRSIFIFSWILFLVLFQQYKKLHFISLEPL